MSAQRVSYVSWQQLSPIFADVVLSPWNLLVGGLLIKFLSPVNALISVVLGYSVLGLVFVLYGGLGYKKRQQSAQILHQVFRGRFSKVFIPLLLAMGQLGWAAINISLGGSSLAALCHVPKFIGLIVYALVIAVIASLQLARHALIKFAIIISSVSLISYLAVSKILHGDWSSFANYQPMHQKSLFWGCSVVVASLISFATVSPDFFQSIKHKGDIMRSTLVGITIPGVLVCSMGCFFFFNRQLNLASLIGSLSFAFVPNVFNTVANTDGSVALYTPALKFGLLFKLRQIDGIVIGAAFSLGLAILGITNYIEGWLKFLSLVSPIFIGVTFAAVLFEHNSGRLSKAFPRQIYWLTAAVCLSLIAQSLPVLLGLLLPLLFYSIYLQFKHIHE